MLQGSMHLLHNLHELENYSTQHANKYHKYLMAMNCVIRSTQTSDTLFRIVDSSCGLLWLSFCLPGSELSANPVTFGIFTFESGCDEGSDFCFFLCLPFTLPPLLPGSSLTSVPANQQYVKS